MKRWLRILIPLFEATIVLAVIYFEPTYCVRGELWREAFFEDRPTSYWRKRIDRWMSQFDNIEQAIAMIDWDGDQDGTGQLVFSGVNVVFVQKSPTFLERAKSWVKWPEDAGDDWMVPRVLRGGPHAEPVLRELAAEDRFQTVAHRALSKQKGNTSGFVIRTKSGAMTIIVGSK
jgi:hypothetical protein